MIWQFSKVAPFLKRRINSHFIVIRVFLNCLLTMQTYPVIFRTDSLVIFLYPDGVRIFSMEVTRSKIEYRYYRTRQKYCPMPEDPPSNTHKAFYIESNHSKTLPARVIPNRARKPIVKNNNQARQLYGQSVKYYKSSK